MTTIGMSTFTPALGRYPDAIERLRELAGAYRSVRPSATVWTVAYGGDSTWDLSIVTETDSVATTLGTYDALRTAGGMKPPPSDPPFTRHARISLWASLPGADSPLGLSTTARAMAVIAYTAAPEVLADVAKYGEIALRHGLTYRSAIRMVGGIGPSVVTSTATAPSMAELGVGLSSLTADPDWMQLSANRLSFRIGTTILNEILV